MEAYSNEPVYKGVLALRMRPPSFPITSWSGSDNWPCTSTVTFVIVKTEGVINVPKDVNVPLPSPVMILVIEKVDVSPRISRFPPLMRLAVEKS